jgi:hypothetical protein
LKVKRARADDLRFVSPEITGSETEMGIANQHQRLKRLEVSQAGAELVVVRIIDGLDNPDELLDRMIASGEIAEHQRDTVQFIRWVICAPIWVMSPDGGARLVGRRNVYTGEIENLGVLTDEELEAIAAQDASLARPASNSEAMQ